MFILRNLYLALLTTSGTQRYAANPYNQPRENVLTALRSCTIIMRLTEALYVSQLIVFAGLYAVGIDYLHNTDPHVQYFLRHAYIRSPSAIKPFHSL